MAKGRLLLAQSQPRPSALAVRRPDVHQHMGQPCAPIEIELACDAHPCVRWLEAPAIGCDARLCFVGAG